MPSAGFYIMHSLRSLRRRHWRWLVIAALFFLFFLLLDTPFAPPPSAPHPTLNLVRSSYDWSKWQPHNPVPSESLQPLPTAKPEKLARIQHVPSRHPKFDIAVQGRRRAEIKRAMQKSWNSYREFAWMRDELTPLTGTGKDTFSGWAATLVDALDTLWIMGMKEEFHEAAQAAVTLDWDVTQDTACNIKEPALLAKAVELGDMLYAGFDTPNHMPAPWLDFEKAKTGRLVPDDHQAAASAASLSMEFTRLAQLTGDNKYYDAVARVTDKLFESQNITGLPGMWPTFFDLRNGIFHNHDNTFTLGALSDSMYEYVLKMHLLLAATEPKYEQLYRATADTIVENLVFRPVIPDNLDILFTGTYHAEDPAWLETEGQHLACFVGGMLALGGRVLDIPGHVDIGARLTNGCIWAYNAFPTGLAPEIFKLVPCESLEGCEWDEQKWLEAVTNDEDGRDTLPKGFQNAREPAYLLRPEALESAFILYRITGQEEYREAAWEMFQSIQKVTETEYGYAAIEDVTVTGKPEQRDSMESFWMAETLKYLYLIFSPTDVVSLDDYVLNTEAHPLRIHKQ
ncbi:hypothetical protein PMZ80_002986 [Knufia obscura]|uniref:alpha-1,2-Mannosidase n=1 Tax=Knufia obscura TaxID=1635080 RepID=A0ABR0RYU7_9EURO|nr:hypothetical protein PMZ80_002986 [Knufia obscura]